MKSKTFALAAFILGLMALSQLALDLYLPSMPHMTGPLQTSRSLVQQSITAYAFTYMFAQLVFGPLSDAWGRRLTLLLGLVIFIVGAVGSALSTSIGFLLWMRALTGFGGGATGVISRSIMRDVFEGPLLRRIGSYQAITWATVPLLAPVIGGYIQEWIGWRANFFTIALAGGVSFLAVVFLLPETRDHAHRQPFHPVVITRNYLSLLKNRQFVGFILSVGVVYSGFLAYNVASPFLLQARLGLSPTQYGWSMVIVGFGVMAGGWVSSRLSHRLSLRTLLLSSVSLALASDLTLLSLGLSGVFTVSAIVIPVFLVFFFQGIAWPNAAVGAIEQFPKIAGSAAALIGLAASSIGTLVSFIVAHLSTNDQVPLAWTKTTLMALCLLFLLVLALRNPMQERR